MSASSVWYAADVGPDERVAQLLNCTQVPATRVGVTADVGSDGRVIDLYARRDSNSSRTDA